jgi:UDP-2,3-diacylglucosamine pyrophosphatase LpxH
MHLQLMSDLHLETQPGFVPIPAPRADALVLAGDIGSYQAGSRLQGEWFGLERFSPKPEFAAWPVPVLFVPGNHEHDMQELGAARTRLRHACDRLGIAWLERETLLLDGVRFVGTTLWSDFDALACADDTPARNLQRREKAFRAANHYLPRYGTLRGGQPMLAAAMREEALLCQQWLRTVLQQPHGGPTVAVTHFAPSLRSADPRYGLAPGTAGFCNALDDLLPYADLWLHGHLHAPSDYVAEGLRHGQAAACRVVANPLGYASKGEQAAFDPVLCLPVRRLPVAAAHSAVD